MSELLQDYLPLVVFIAVAIAIGLALLPSYWYFWKKAPEFSTTRRALVAIYFFTIWYNFIAGHILNNVRGFDPQ